MCLCVQFEGVDLELARSEGRFKEVLGGAKAV